MKNKDDFNWLLGDYDSVHAIRSGMVRAMLESPLVCWEKYYNPNAVYKQTRSCEIGLALHKAFLTQSKKVIISNRRTRIERIHAEIMKADGYMVLPPAMGETINAMLDALYSTREVERYINFEDATNTVAEHALIKTRFARMPMKAQFDWIDFRNNRIVELKTTSQFNYFSTQIDQYGYLLQAAHYLSVLGNTEFNYSIIAVESVSPHRIKIYDIAPNVIPFNQWSITLNQLDDILTDNEGNLDSRETWAKYETEKTVTIR